MTPRDIVRRAFERAEMERAFEGRERPEVRCAPPDECDASLELIVQKDRTNNRERRQRAPRG